MEAERVVDTLAPFMTEARRLRMEAVLAARTGALSLVLDNLGNAHNGSAILRSADAFGVQHVHVVESDSTFKAARGIASGAHEWVTTTRHANVSEAYAALKAQGFQVWAAAVHGDAQPVDALPIDGKLALVFGNEGAGLSDAALSFADGCFHVPMRGMVESFNVSVAVAITLATTFGRRSVWPPLSDPEKMALRAAWYARSVRAAAPILARAGLSMPPPPDAGRSLVEDRR